MEPDSSAPLVSLIVRTKDRPTLLLRALRSIAAQTYRPIEVVLVNDGGAPLDAAALAAATVGVALQHHRLETNRGRAHAANVGIGLARGRYIGFLDDDDALYPPHVQALVSLIANEGCAVAYANVEMVTQAHAEDTDSFVDVQASVFDTDFSYAHLLISNFIPFNALLFDAEVLRAAHGLDESFELYEDWDLLIRVAKDHRFAHLHQVTARYHQWSEVQQINRSSAERMQAATQRILAKHHALLTPELVLQYRSLRDAHDAELREAIARGAKHAGQLETRLADRDATLVQRDALLAQRDHELAQRDLHLAERDRQLASSEARAAEHAEHALRFQALADERDVRIHQLDSDMRLAHAQFQGELQERSRQIAVLNAEIGAMRATLGW